NRRAWASAAPCSRTAASPAAPRACRSATSRPKLRLAARSAWSATATASASTFPRARSNCWCRRASWPRAAPPRMRPAGSPRCRDRARSPPRSRRMHCSRPVPTREPCATCPCSKADARLARGGHAPGRALAQPSCRRARLARSRGPRAARRGRRRRAPRGVKSRARPCGAAAYLSLPARQLLLHRHVLQRYIGRDAVAAVRRRQLAADQRLEVGAGLVGDAVAVATDVALGEGLLVVGHLVQRRAADLP